MTKWVYTFGGGKAEGASADRDLLGGKGANLAEMCNLGLPVPPGLTIITDACAGYYKNGRTIPDDLKAQVRVGISRIEEITGRVFGDNQRPLLLSVRSGARASMPGMMDTVLNLGLNDRSVQALGHDAGDARFAWDSYRRFIQMYGDVVMGLDHEIFEEILEDEKGRLGHGQDTELSAVEWQHVISLYKRAIEEELGESFPQDPEVQLWGAIGAVFSSWMNARAVTYRHLHNIPAEWGTAVNVQAMVFGNLGNSSATGVAFTRNPSTGENELYGEFLVNAQGEDVVAGIRTPQNITEASRLASGSDKPSLEKLMPEAFEEFRAICDTLEAHYKDMQDLEFTIERGKLWMLQTRSGKRTAKAALKIAVDMADSKADHAAPGRHPHRSGLARPVAASDHRSARQARYHRLRPAGLAGCCHRRDRLHVGRGRSGRKGRPQGHSRAHRDEPGGHSRHACRRGHPDLARRHDQPCGRRCPRHGHSLRFRRRQYPRRSAQRTPDRRRCHAEEGRHHHH